MFIDITQRQGKNDTQSVTILVVSSCSSPKNSVQSSCVFATQWCLTKMKSWKKMRRTSVFLLSKHDYCTHAQISGPFCIIYTSYVRRSIDFFRARVCICIAPKWRLRTNDVAIPYMVSGCYFQFSFMPINHSNFI